MVFAQNEASLVQGVSDPTAFFTNLKGVFAVGTPLQTYLHGSSGKGGAVGTEACIQSCLKTLGAGAMTEYTGANRIVEAELKRLALWLAVSVILPGPGTDAGGRGTAV